MTQAMEDSVPRQKPDFSKIDFGQSPFIVAGSTVGGSIGTDSMILQLTGSTVGGSLNLDAPGSEVMGVEPSPFIVADNFIGGAVRISDPREHDLDIEYVPWTP